ncbi:MAG TPA: hypothetical protein VFD70_06820 [Anaerolineae bacterium]|nr:hypothetical protein [Anaerolineae bacterium]
MTNTKRVITGSGVKRGYKPKQKSVKRHEVTLAQKTLITLNQLARETLAYLADEMVYATIDTVRVLRYIRAEFGRAPRRRSESKNHALREYETILESGTLAAEPLATWSIERRAYALHDD